MSKKSVVIMPETQRVLETMGEQIKMARLRRNLATELVAERAGISRATLWSVEKGSPTVSIGTYAAVLHALGGMDMDFENVAKDDELGKKLQDLNLLSGKRAKRG
ncbi:MAG TPA: helix-turn-helix domain-containing protein [Clostridiaceae bacterium]|jgi:transcriptional regulator with XRE-family HTH domain|nr:helix-turn-helix domain-containing protein [Clostridiaceae bacterium]